MVGIVTGPINSKKTTRMKALHREKGGDGFIMIKTMDGNTVKSYHAQRLSTGEQRLLVLRVGYEDDSFMEATRIGPYRFDASALDWIHSTMKHLIHSHETPLYLDEVGILELRGEGFSAIMDELSQSDKPIYISVREDLVQSVINVYHLKNVRIFKGDEFNG
ncbi:MAG: nucleoside-triphosphatase [Bacillota bacterium]